MLYAIWIVDRFFFCPKMKESRACLSIGVYFKDGIYKSKPRVLGLSLLKLVVYYMNVCLIIAETVETLEETYR